MNLISLSPSKLNLFKQCPRCFFEAYALKCPKPRGIFPSLPGGMDLRLKDFSDNYRGSLPPNLEGKIPGVLWNDPRMNKWRNWRSGPTYVNEKHQVKCVGALDDILLISGHLLAPFDWKTKGSEPKDDGSQYYQNQMDCYDLMVGHQIKNTIGLETAGFAYLVYVWPEQIISDAIPSDQLAFGIRFSLTPFKIETSKARAEETIIKGAECLRGERPDPNPDCDHCVYVENLKELR